MGFWPNYLDKILLLLLGCFIFVATIFNDIPSESELKEVSGTLLSVEKYSRKPVKIRIQGSDIVFSYVSQGRLCVNVYEKLTLLKGKPLTIKYSPSIWLVENDKPKFYKVYDICVVARLKLLSQKLINLGKHASSKTGVVHWLDTLLHLG